VQTLFEQPIDMGSFVPCAFIYVSENSDDCSAITSWTRQDKMSTQALEILVNYLKMLEGWIEVTRRCRVQLKGIVTLYEHVLVKQDLELEQQNLLTTKVDEVKEKMEIVNERENSLLKMKQSLLKMKEVLQARCAVGSGDSATEGCV
jgi:hypothetical protein